MGKASIFLYLTLALLLFFFLSHSPTKQTARRPRRLKIHSNFTLSSSHRPRPVAFDPLVAEIERRQWEKHYSKDFAAVDSDPGEEYQPGWEDFIDAEDYLNDKDKFNVTHRLISLFPKLDQDPTDGFISEHELTQWNLQQAQRDTLHRTKRDMELHDENLDGCVSFSEYQPPTWLHIADNDSSDYDIGWWREKHFNASDADGNGLLNLTEYNDFLHPADTKNPKLLEWLCREEVRERDIDKDGKINFNEFFHGLFDLVRTYDEENHNVSHHSDVSVDAPARMLFNQLDTDGDGHLSDVELLPIIGKIHPSERYYAKQQADYFISQADGDKDGRLSLAEMIENPYVFYSAIFNGDEDQYNYHDEFR
ncbi:hypothetical protein QN277_004828 [Acacia crassicarpa]|uniref:EF-hand domain-containing protein n=1 Tax=Acacia crassicarpa TaxID=499986 RepID=A0AAE1MC84_9FABA|nr:hypothetical protein QN277_004828 [Acacia crassicarpa]